MKAKSTAIDAFQNRYGREPNKFGGYYLVLGGEMVAYCLKYKNKFSVTLLGFYDRLYKDCHFITDESQVDHFVFLKRSEYGFNDFQ
jgi:hypothetical protein